MPATVVLDTNALLLPFERRLRLEEELERLLGECTALVPSPCIRELERIARDERGARRDRARLAVQFARRFETLETSGPADAAAVRAAKERGAFLLTNDADLVRSARQEGVRVIRLKRLSHLGFDDPDVL